MKKILLKSCKNQKSKKQKEKSMLVLGHEMFEKKTPQIDIPMFKVQNGKRIK